MVNCLQILAISHKKRREDMYVKGRTRCRLEEGELILTWELSYQLHYPAKEWLCHPRMSSNGLSRTTRPDGSQVTISQGVPERRFCTQSQSQRINQMFSKRPFHSKSWFLFHSGVTMRFWERFSLSAHTPCFESLKINGRIFSRRLLPVKFPLHRQTNIFSQSPYCLIHQSPCV